jgi:predicted phosphate transport protein (TIGR00153 family)
MVLRLFPREETFFDLFNDAADNILHAARLLQTLLDDYRDVERQAEAIKALEERGDEITHTIIDRLNRTFVTPFDREDIHELAKQLDNVLDWIEAAVEEARELAHIITSTCEALVDAVRHLRTLSQIDGPVREVNRLENLADRVQRNAIASLFADAADPIDVIKWKEIYDTMEEATDQAEDAANVLEGIRTKHL